MGQLELKQAAMRERQQPIALLKAPDSRPFERHYSVKEIAVMWGLSQDVVRELFADEPGVLVIGDKTGRRKKRRYATLRIPESVVERVHRRRENVAA